MVNVATKILTPGQQIKERIARIKAAHHAPPIRVEPRDDDMRRLLRHPNGVRFRSEGSIEWPNDVFTQRRIRDGSVKVVEGHEAKPHSRGHRTHTRDDDC